MAYLKHPKATMLDKEGNAFHIKFVLNGQIVSADFRRVIWCDPPAALAAQMDAALKGGPKTWLCGESRRPPGSQAK
jgi:hypothetical protein